MRYCSLFAISLLLGNSAAFTVAPRHGVSSTKTTPLMASTLDEVEQRQSIRDRLANSGAASAAAMATAAVNAAVSMKTLEAPRRGKIVHCTRQDTKRVG